jgi:serine O-acetyltransferase
MPKTEGIFRKDLRRYYEAVRTSGRISFSTKLKLFISHHGLHCVAVYRFGQFSRRLKRKNIVIGLPFWILHSVLNALMKFFHHVDIESASIGPGFIIYHVGTIYIGPVKIGENFSVTHNVTIGIGRSKIHKGVPTLGNNVWVGTGCVLFGNISIGHNVIINSGCILSKNVPDNCLVGGNPGRVLINYAPGEFPSDFNESDSMGDH